MPDPKTSLEMIAPSVEEAIARGAAELGLPPEALEVEVLDEGARGMLGLGARQARVRLTLRAHPPVQAEIGPEAEEESRGTEPQQAISVTRETVRELLTRMGIRARVECSWGEAPEPEEPRPLMVDVRGEDLSILIGRRGETLAALQYIVRLIVGKELQEPVPIVIDVQGYRARRERQLRSMARRMAQQAIEQDRITMLEPMSPAERRIIHLELHDHPQVYTESVGEGDRRKVTIIPRR